MNGIISFLSSFKAFFFYTLAFLIFGAAFLFLSQSLCQGSTLCGLLVSFKPSLCNFVKADFNTFGNRIQFLVFSYIGGLLLWVFGRLCFSKRLRRWLDKRALEKEKRKVKQEEKQPCPKCVKINDVGIYIFLEKHNLVTDIYTLELFHSAIIRLLFSIIVLATIFFSSWPYVLASTPIAIVLLFKIGRIADKSVNEFSDQIKEVIHETEGHTAD